MGERFNLKDGKYCCANPDCDWWVPQSMEYLSDNHDCDEWAKTEKQYTDEAFTQKLSESVERALNGECCENLEEVFGECVNEDETEDTLDDIPDQHEVEERLDELRQEDEEENGLSKETIETLEDRAEDLEKDDKWVDIDELLEETPGEEEAEEMANRHKNTDTKDQTYSDEEIIHMIETTRWLTTEEPTPSNICQILNAKPSRERIRQLMDEARTKDEIEERPQINK